ncbi:MAG: right-handed parallel beta-helix repeat-containing protein, partial [Planctomycetes bacterium]|nr:right-handed parallel beta-helix repeat-containing protein [Planctomycetota bacterium]
SAALKLDGSIYSWGLWIGNPVPPAGNDFVQVECGSYHGVALRSNGTIASWGRDNSGVVTNTPTGAGYLQVDGGNDFSAAIRADGSIEVWGLPIPAPAGTGYMKIECGPDYIIAATAAGTIHVTGLGNQNGIISDAPDYDFALVDFGAGVNYATVVGAPDCNGNLIPDPSELLLGTATDCNLNNVLDECEFIPGTPTNCGGVGIGSVGVYQYYAYPAPALASEILTDASAGGTQPRPMVRVEGWGFELGGLVNHVELRTPTHSVTVDAQASTPGVISFNLPSFPPGLEEGSDFSVDMVVTNANGESNIFVDAFTYRIFDVPVGPGPGSNVQAAINSALPGTRIKLSPFSSYTGFQVDLTGKTAITLMGFPGDPSAVECFGNLTQPGINLSSTDSTVVVSGLQIRDSQPGIRINGGCTSIVSDCFVEGNVGNLSSGAGIDITGTSKPIIQRIRVNQNGGSVIGGGIAIQGASAVISDCDFVENSAITGGGLSINATTPGEEVRVFGCTFQCNQATTGKGGAVFVGLNGRARFYGSDFSLNYAALHGSAISAELVGLLEVAACDFSNNGNGDLSFACGAAPPLNGHTEGGAIYVNSDQLPLIEDCSFTGNVASVGGAIFVADASNPRIARNCFTCNLAKQAPADSSTAFYAPAIYVEGTSFSTSAQPDILNNTFKNNRVVGTPGVASNARGHAIHTGFMGQGLPQFDNNLIVQSVAEICDGETYIPQGWGIHIQSNRFTSVRYNQLFAGLEGSGGGCDGSVFTPDDAVCTTCCPLSAIVDGNDYADPFLGDPCSEVLPGSPAYHTGLSGAPALPSKLYLSGFPVSRGKIDRDGVLPNPVQAPLLANQVVEVGSCASVTVTGAAPSVCEAQVDVDLVALPSILFDVPVTQVTHVATYEFRNGSGAVVAGPDEVTLDLPTMPVFNPACQLALFRFDPSIVKFVDTGYRSSSVNAKVSTFDLVPLLAQQMGGSYAASLVGVVVDPVVVLGSTY